MTPSTHASFKPRWLALRSLAYALSPICATAGSATGAREFVDETEPLVKPPPGRLGQRQPWASTRAAG